MASLNKVILIGNLGKDPEIRYTQSNQAVATFSLATTDNWTGQDGNKQERTEWHRIVAWGKLADLSQRFLAKGRQVYIEGRIQSREWTDKDGNKRNTTEVIASSILFLGSRNAQGGDYGAPQGATSQSPSTSSYGGSSYGSGSYGGGKPQVAEASYPGTESEQPFGDAGITDSDIPF
jgi:single-strand DNA-binding protein